MKVIGVAGQLQNGKDTVADYLCPKLNFYDYDKYRLLDRWERGAFANEVKRLFGDAFGVDRDFIEKWKVISDPPPGFEKPIRQGLQFIGDGFREIVPTIWIDLAFRNQTKNMVVSDARYINELAKVRSEKGVNILVYRPGYLNNDPNGSEAQLKPIIEFFIGLDDYGFWEGRTDSEDFKNAVSAWGVHQDDQLKSSDVPEGVEFVDIFLRNDRTPKELYQKVDDIVLNYVVEVLYDRPDENQSERCAC